MDENKKNIPFLITISYFISFLFIRLMVYIAGAANTEFAKVAKMGLTPDVRFYIGRNIILFGYHIHHFYFGILLICIAGWIAIVGSPIFSRKQTAVIYGAGLGLFMDEIGLLLTWGDYYSALSYLLSIFLAGLILNIIFFHNFWEEVKRNFLQSGAHSIIWVTLSKNASLIKIADIISEKTGKTEKTSLFFTGIIYLFVCVLILMYPEFLRYWVSGTFLIQGLTHLVRAWEK